MKKIRKAVIPVAGMGTRFLPATKAIPKEMLPIIDKPSIQYIVEEAVLSGIEEILFIVSPYKKSLEDHFDRSYELESRLNASGKTDILNKIKDLSSMCKFYYVRQGEPKGSGHAVNLAKSFVGDEAFAVLYGDDLMKFDVPVLKQLIDVYEKNDANVIGVNEVDYNVVDRYGIVDFYDKETLKIRRLVEKPSKDEAPSNYAGVGRYILKKEIFDELDNISEAKNGEYLLTDAMASLMKKQDFYGCKFIGNYFDIGNQLEYIKANIEFGLDRDDLKENLMNYLKGMEYENKRD